MFHVIAVDLKIAMQQQNKLNHIQFIIHFHFIDNKLNWYIIKYLLIVCEADL